MTRLRQALSMLVKIAILSLLTWAPVAWPQVSASATVVSDYRWRGVSLSNGQAVPQFNVNYDNSQDWYAGLLISGVRFSGDGAGHQVVSYAGYGRRWEPGLSWDCGVSNVLFQPFNTYNYHEWFIGMASNDVSARVYYAPHYFDQRSGSLYAEINASYPLGERLQLLAHGGFLLNRTDQGLKPMRTDLRFGLNRTFDRWIWQVAFTWVSMMTPPYPNQLTGTPRSLILSASHAF